MYERKGLFIVLEGMEGSGKTTQIKVAETLMRSWGYDVVTVREPGGTELGEQLRKCILAAPLEVRPTPVAEMLLLQASRSQLTDTVIKPALNEGYCVISDRYTLSTYAYQGSGRGWSVAAIKMLGYLVDSITPDLTLVLDLPAQLSMQRVAARGNPDRIELEDLAFFERVRRGYHDYAAQHSSRVKLIDASKDASAVSQAVYRALYGFIRKRESATE